MVGTTVYHIMAQASTIAVDDRLFPGCQTPDVQQHLATAYNTAACAPFLPDGMICWTGASVQTEFCIATDCQGSYRVPTLQGKQHTSEMQPMLPNRLRKMNSTLGVSCAPTFSPNAQQANQRNMLLL